MGSVFKPKTPKIETPAPAVDEPVREPESPELGYTETADQKKRKGKKGLKINLNKPSTSTSGGGVNVV